MDSRTTKTRKHGSDDSINLTVQYTACVVCCYCNIIECMYAYAELCNYRFLY